MLNLKKESQKKKFEYLLDGEPIVVKPETVLAESKAKFQSSYSKNDNSKYDEFELAYRGTQTTLANINSKKKQTVKKTNVVRNVVYEMIESQVNTEVPEPNVISRKPGYEEQARMIEEKIKSDIEYLMADRMADTLERHTYTNGVGVVMLNWDNKAGTHSELGEKELINKHPKQVITQPSIYEFCEMGYTAIVSMVTKEYIQSRYGIDVENESVSYSETNRIVDDSDNSYSKNESDDDLVTEVYFMYLDDDGDVGTITWVGDTIVEFEPKYCYPRTAICKECGAELSQDTKICTKCGSKKIRENISTVETIEEEMVLSPISYMTDKKVVVDDPSGRRTQINKVEHIEERVVPAGTKIQRFALNKFPLIKRINIPLAFSFRGVSDIEVIATLQESLKKVLSRIEEKILMSVAVVGLPNGMSETLSNDIYQVITGKPADISQMQFHDMKADITQDLEYAATLYQYAKDTIGVTDAYQGKYDASARTGTAKEIQVQQSASRLQSKYKNKYIFYRELFQMMYFFDLMFTQESRSYMTKNAIGTITYKEFNKYELLCQDADDKWYYNTDFIFKARQSSEIPSDDVSIMNKTIELAQAKLIEKDQMWQILDALDYPLARKMLEQTRSQMDQKVEMLLGALSQMSPEMLPQFLQRPVEEQMEMLTEILEQENQNQQ